MEMVVESAAMNGDVKCRIVNRWLGTRARVWAVGIAVLVSGAAFCGGVQGQGAAGSEEGATTVRGRVLNRATKEPIGRALVRMGDEYAMFTDDRGQFEFKVVTQGDPGTLATGSRFEERRLDAMKPGFLPRGVMATTLGATARQTEVTIYLVPEALIVGHVMVPGSEGDGRIECELYKREVSEGQETWSRSGTFMTWADGEFRFSELKAGTYKLITHEQMDRDSLLPVPGARSFGFPPIYYQNTTDFSVASAIVVKGGETAQANLTVARREYYPVRIPVGIPVRKATAVAPMNLVVYPMGHWGPGWSLGYNPMEQTIEGMLQDGNYTVELESFGAARTSTWIANFEVRGAAFEGTPVHLVPNTSITVNVRTEFQSGQSGSESESAGGATSTRLANARVMLRALEKYGSGERDLQARSVDGSDDPTLVIDNVRPGKYRVEAFSGAGYVASIESGGRDVMKQPLVVGLGGEVPPIEVTLRDDWAEVSGTVEEVAGAEGNSQQNRENWRSRVVYLVPIGQGTGQQPLEAAAWDEPFVMKNVPPGDYIALAYEKQQTDLPFSDEEFVKSMESKGQKIHVEAGEKVNVRLKVISGATWNEDGATEIERVQERPHS